MMLMRRIRGFFNVYYYQRGSVGSHQEYFDALPRTLRHDLACALNYTDTRDSDGTFTGPRHALLQHIAFFDGLDVDDKIRICCRLRHMRARPPIFDENGDPDMDAFIMQEGDRGNEMWIIAEGMVRVEKLALSSDDIIARAQAKARGEAWDDEGRLGDDYKVHDIEENVARVHEARIISLGKLRKYGEKQPAPFRAARRLCTVLSLSHYSASHVFSSTAVAVDRFLW